MHKYGKVAVTGGLTAAMLAFVFSTPPDLSMHTYGLGLAVVYALGAKAIQHDVEKYFVLGGYILWIMAYVWQIYYGFQFELSTWPLFSGSYYIVNEFITCCTTMYETPGKGHGSTYVTPAYVRVGYYVYFALDFILNMMTLYYGTGSSYDELGIFPMNTMAERTFGFLCWCSFWCSTQYALARIFGPRQAKYSMVAFHYVCHFSSVRLPIFAQLHSHAGLSNTLKLQIFGSAAYIVRANQPCEPENLFRVFFFFLTPVCALTVTSLFPALTGMSTLDFRTMVVSILVGFWILLILIRKTSNINKVTPKPTQTPAKQRDASIKAS